MKHVKLRHVMQFLLKHQENILWNIVKMAQVSVSFQKGSLVCDNASLKMFISQC